MTKVALVTGSTAGIGRAVAEALSEEGYSIIVTGRREEKEAAELMNKLGKESVYVRGDIADAQTRSSLLETVKTRFGHLDCLVNNAGMTTIGRKDLLDLEEQDVLTLFKTNLIGPMMLSKSLAPLMKSETSSSYIVNISSISAYTVSTNRADYCMSKAGLSMMTQLLGARLAEDNIFVYEIRPGIIKTDMTAGVTEKYDKLIGDGLLPIKRWGSPDDIARTVIGIVKGYLPYSTGNVINVDGGFHIRRL